MERKVIVEKVQEIFRNVLDDNSIVLANTTTVDDIEGWDSLSHIQLIVAIEKEFKVKFTSKDMLSWQNVGDIFNSLENSHN